MKDHDAAALFGVLANADRLTVIRALVEAGSTGMTAGDIARRINASPSRASFHLSSLADTGLATKRQVSRTQNYQINFATLAALMSYLMKDCCKGIVDLTKDR